MTLHQRWKQTSLHNKALVWIGAFAAFGTVFYAGAAAVQVYIMKTASAESTKQITAVADKAKEIIDSIRTTEAQTKDALTESLAQNRSALEASKKQAKEALDARIEASRNDQLAWIGIKSIQITTKIAPGVVSEFQIRVANTGKTPAKEVAIKASAVGFYPITNFPTSAPTLLPINPTFLVIAPGEDQLFFYARDEKKQLTKERSDMINAGTMRMYLFSTIEYRDVFGKLRKTTFCAYFPTDRPPNLFNCPFGNEMK